MSAKKLLPDPKTISRRCQEKATTKRKAIVAEIQEMIHSDNVGMTTDMWTDDYRKVSYMAITCHFIMADFKLKSNVLTTAMFPHDEAKTADNIRKELQKQLVSVLKFDPSVMSKVVWVTDQGSNIVAALRPYRRLDCQDHIYNTVLRHALGITELSVTVPEVGGALLAVKKVVRFMKQSGLASQLSKTILQMGETRFSTVYLPHKSITDVYAELREKLESRGEAQRMAVSPDVLDFLVGFLHPFYEAQRELEGDQ